jgi:hypothetical protein
MADNRQSKLRAPSERKGPASRHTAPSRHDPRGGRGPGRRFRKGHNAHGEEVFRRGPDLIPRGSIDLLFRTLLDDDGGLERELKRYTSFRHQLAHGFFRAAEHPRTAILVADRIADRLEGKPTRRTEKRDIRHTIIYKAGDPPPWFKAERELVEDGKLPWPPLGGAPASLPPAPPQFEELRPARQASVAQTRCFATDAP